MSLRHFSRELAWRVMPDVMADRARRYERKYRERHGITAAAERLVSEQGPVVTAGPFAGLRYPPTRLADVDTPVGKLTGVYEAEIQASFDAAVARGVSTFFDVGCADGYYAVGMPYAVPGLTAYAFDLSTGARELCREVSRLNGVEDRVKIGKRFSLRSLEGLDLEGALMLCDIEGAEVHLFDQALVSRLRGSTVVIEVHEDSQPGAGSQLESRFAGSHSVQLISQREIADDATVAEHRAPLLHWLIAEPRLS